VMVLEVVLIPLAFAFVLVRARIAKPTLLTDTEQPFFRLLRVLFSAFRFDFSFWECVILVRRTVLVSVAVFVSQNDNQRLVISAICNLIFFLFQLLARPFHNAEENVVETLSLLLLLLLSLILATQSYPLSESAQIGIGIYLFVPALALLIWVARAKLPLATKLVRYLSKVQPFRCCRGVHTKSVAECDEDLLHTDPKSTNHSRRVPVDSVVELSNDLYAPLLSSDA